MRSSAGEPLRMRVQRLAEKTRSGVKPPPPRLDVESLIERARGIQTMGRLDEAATVYDAIIAGALRALDRIDAPSALVGAMVGRATIALARHEQPVADQLLTRLVRWDPAFSLTEAEARPRVSAALAAARGRLAERPAISGEDLGDLCAQGRRVLVGRHLGDGADEIALFVDCRLTASVSARDLTDDAVLRGLGLEAAPTPPPPSAAVAGAASLPPRSIAIESANAPAARVKKRKWVWGVVGGVGAILAATALGLGLGLGLHSNDADTIFTPHL